MPRVILTLKGDYLPVQLGLITVCSSKREKDQETRWLGEVQGIFFQPQVSKEFLSNLGKITMAYENQKLLVRETVYEVESISDGFVLGFLRWSDYIQALLTTTFGNG